MSCALLLDPPKPNAARRFCLTTQYAVDFLTVDRREAIHLLYLSPLGTQEALEFTMPHTTFLNYLNRCEAAHQPADLREANRGFVIRNYAAPTSSYDHYPMRP